MIARSATTLFYTPVSSPHTEITDKFEPTENTVDHNADLNVDAQATDHTEASLPQDLDSIPPSASYASSRTAVDHEQQTMSVVQMPQPSIQRQDEVAPGYTQGAHPDVMIDKKHPHPTSTDVASSAGSGELSPTTHGTFAAGSGTAAELPDEPALHNRAATAETTLSNEEKAKLEKMEGTRLLPETTSSAHSFHSQRCQASLEDDQERRQD